MDPNNQDTLFGIGACLSMLGKHSKAVSWFDKTLAIDPKDIYALASKAASLHRLKKTEEAHHCIEEALSIDPHFEFALDIKKRIGDVTKSPTLPKSPSFTKIPKITSESALRVQPSESALRVQKSSSESSFRKTPSGRSSGASTPQLQGENMSNPDVESWSVFEVTEWMSHLHLSKEYNSLVKEHNINGLVLKTMTKEDWNSLGLTVFGDVRTLTIATKTL